MNQYSKWILSSGRCVEDIIFQKGTQLPAESLLHSWVIDLDDLGTKRLFTENEWQEIVSEICKKPKVDEFFAKSLARFRNVSYFLFFFRIYFRFYWTSVSLLLKFQVKTTNDLRHILETTSYKEKDETYSREQHFDPEWAETVIRHM